MIEIDIASLHASCHQSTISVFNDSICCLYSFDEKVGEIILLTKGELFHPRPSDMQPLPAWRVEAEILWNNTPYWVFLILIVVAIAIGLVASRWHKKWLACG